MVIIAVKHNAEHFRIARRGDERATSEKYARQAHVAQRASPLFQHAFSLLFALSLLIE